MGPSLFSIVQFALLTFLAAIGVNLLIAVGGFVWAVLVRSEGREQPLRDAIVRYARIVNGLSGRVEARKEAATGAAAELFGVQRQEKQLRSRLRELEMAPHRFVRLLGSEARPHHPFEALIFNSSVAHQAKRGEKHPFYDASWGMPCPVHVWARTLDEAKHELERAFPASGGFKVVHIQPLPLAEEPAPAGDPPPPEAA